MFLDDEKICAILIDYLQNDKTNQAVLIDGEWGSGKTYFICNVFMEKFEALKKKKELCKSKELLYLSLYGMTNTDEIQTAIYEKMLEKCITKNISKKAVVPMKVLQKLAPAGLECFGINGVDKLKDVVKDIKPISDMVIVFDDLERCNIEINEVLGYINNLVEHNNVKAIILANEKEIWRSGFSVNLAEKYKTALTHLQMLHEHSNNPQENPDLTKISSIQEHAEAIFSQDNGYEKVKEKLIGLRIRYSKPLRLSYDSVLKSIVDDEDTKIILQSSSNIILNQFNDRKNTNIRTLAAVFISFQKINTLINRSQTECNEFIESVKISILDYLTWCTLEVKSGGQLEPWGDRDDFSKNILITTSDGRRIIYGYRVVHDLVSFGFIDEDEFIRDFEKYTAMAGEIAAYKKFIETESALSELINWRLLEDDEVEEYLKQLETELVSKKYKVSNFGQIVYTLVDISRHGFAIVFDSYLNPIKEHIKSGYSGNVSAAGFRAFENDNEANTLFANLVNSLIKLVEKTRKAGQTTKHSYLNTGEWDIEFITKCQEDSNYFMNANKFFAFFDVDSFKEKINHATAKEVFFFLGAIKQVYNFNNIQDCYKGDIENLRQMLAITEEELKATNKKTLHLNLGMLSDVMKNYLQRLESSTPSA